MMDFDYGNREGSLIPWDRVGMQTPLGFPGMVCDLAIRADNAPMLRECVDRNFIDASCEMLDGKVILQFCAEDIESVSAGPDGKPVKSLNPRAPKCYSMLRALGWSVPRAKAEAFCID